MEDLKAWGIQLSELRTRTGLSLNGFLDEISEFNHLLSDVEKEALRTFGIETFLSMSRTALSDYENGKRHPQSRDRVALLIYFFAKKGVIQHEEASDWLKVMDWQELSKEEKQFLFSGQTEDSGVVRHASPSSKRKEPRNVFFIPERDLPDNIQGYSIVREAGRGLIITLIAICLLTVVLISMLRNPAVIETLQWLKHWFAPPIVTPQPPEPTPTGSIPAARTLSPTTALPPTLPATGTLSSEAYYQQGLAHVKQQQREAAVADFSQAIAQNPDYAEAYFSRGITFSGLGQYALALDDFTEAIRLKPTDALSYYQRALIRRIRKEWDAALLDFNQAIALQPDFALAFRDRGLTYQQLDKLSEALNNLRHYLQLRPDAEDRTAIQQRIADMEVKLKKSK